MIVLGVLLLTVGALAFDPFYRPHLDGRIVGGHAVDIEDYAHQLSLMLYGDHICGASIISSKWALTASHCVDGSYPDEISVRAGSSIQGQGGQVRQIKEIIMHPKYGNSDYDYALLRVSKAFKLGTAVQAIRIADSEPEVGDKVEVSGWGTLSSGGALPRQLQAVTVNIIDRTKCNREYEGGITARMICAAARNKDSCQGDSGGPLITEGGEQIGVVSWGAGCADPNYAGVYANLANREVRNWIEEETGI